MIRFKSRRDQCGKVFRGALTIYSEKADKLSNVSDLNLFVFREGTIGFFPVCNDP